MPRIGLPQASIPPGFHIEYPQGRGEDGFTFSEDELRARFAESRAIGAKGITCGYCKMRHKGRTVAGLVRWFHSHECGDTHDSMTCACIAEAA